MASKKKLKARIAVLEERLVSANNYNEAILKEANAHRDVIEDIIKAIVTNFFDDGYFDATVREVRATVEWENAKAKKERVKERICEFCNQGVAPHDWNMMTRSHESCFDKYVNSLR